MRSKCFEERIVKIVSECSTGLPAAGPKRSAKYYETPPVRGFLWFGRKVIWQRSETVSKARSLEEWNIHWAHSQKGLTGITQGGKSHPAKLSETEFIYTVSDKTVSMSALSAHQLIFLLPCCSSLNATLSFVSTAPTLDVLIYLLSSCPHWLEMPAQVSIPHWDSFVANLNIW